MTQPKYKNIALIGVGLIGGSIGLAAQKLGLAHSVTGIGRRESSLQVAIQVGAVTATTTHIAEGVASDRLVDELVAWGDEDALRARVQEHWDAGADHVCIQTFRSDGEAGPDMKALELLAPNS